MIDIGLATNRDYVYRLISIALKKPQNAVSNLKVSGEDFKKLTVSSRMVNRILKILNQSTAAMLK